MEPVTERVSVAAREPGTTSLDAFVTAAYDAHATSIYGLALRSTRDAELAADVTQEAFLRLLTEGQRGRLPDNLGGWLYRTSSNLIVSGARRRSVASRFALRLVTRDEPDGPEAILLGNEQHRDLDAALSDLSVDDRLALVLSAQGAMAPYDIAANPPAAIIYNLRMQLWFDIFPRTAAYAVRHYVPLTRDLWVPGMTAILEPQRPATWVAPAAGRFTLPWRASTRSRTPAAPCRRASSRTAVAQRTRTTSS